MIVADHLSKRYRGKQAVDNISFTVKTGRVTGFLGPNGAGKSTTMRLMLGLDKGQGTTLFDGKRLVDYKRPAKVIGILLDAKAYHPTRSARDHLKILAAAGGVPTTNVDEALELVGLHDVAKGKPGKFSLGMSQRLGIAAAILGKPKYLMLDEPANGLDPEGIAWLREFMENYADQGNAVFISSHLLSEMSQMADDLVVIGKGKLIANAPVSEVLRKNGHGGIFVRSPQLASLARTLEAHKLQVVKDQNGIKVQGATSDQIGKLAFQAGIPLAELSPQQASLEEAFLELTANAQEYKTPGVKS